MHRDQDGVTFMKAPAAAPPAPEGGGGALLSFLESLIGGASLLGCPERRAPPPREEKRAQSPCTLSAEAFRDAVRAHKAETVEQKQALTQEAQLERRRQIKLLLEQHLRDESWRELLAHAELAALNGEQEMMLLRFPSDLCSDGGRKIDVAEDGWEETLRGEPAELYSRWRTELRPLGFGLSARIVSFEDKGIIGDLGLYLTWGD